jgi:hypothetical protein
MLDYVILLYNRAHCAGLYLGLTTTTNETLHLNFYMEYHKAHYGPCRLGLGFYLKHKALKRYYISVY